MSYNFNDEIRDAEKAFNLGGNKFKFVEGDNRVRIMSPGKPLATHRVSETEFHTCYGAENGCKWHGENEAKRTDVRFVMWIIDRKDGKIKLAFFPYTIMKNLAMLQEDPDYRFDDMPMPYDINVNALKAGKKDVTYTVIARKETPLTAEETADWSKQKPIEEMIERLKGKEAKGEDEEE